MLRKFLRRFGVYGVTLGTTLASVLLSVLLTIIIELILDKHLSPHGVTIALVIPAIIAPIFSLLVFSLLAQLDEAERRLHTLSTIDELTGAYSRRYFLDLANMELRRASRDGSKFSIAMLDMDHLKQINDNHGHLAGDQALREVSRACRENIRANDVFARYGGDEFILLFPGTDVEEAGRSLERVLQVINALTLEHEGRVIGPRVSIGMHSYGADCNTLDAILAKADLALYKAKQQGRNRLVYETGG